MPDNAPLPDERSNKFAPADATDAWLDPLVVEKRDQPLGDEAAAAVERSPLEYAVTLDDDGNETGVSTWSGEVDELVLANAAEEQISPDTRAILSDLQPKHAVQDAVEDAKTAGEDADTAEPAKPDPKIVKFRERMESLEREHPDDYWSLNETISDPDLQISQAMTDFVLDHDGGPAIVFHLAMNPRLAADLSALPQAEQRERLSNLADSGLLVGLPRKVKPTQAPEPIGGHIVSGGGAGATRDPAKMGQDEYNAGRRAGRIR